jgi:hypothetical protein
MHEAISTGRIVTKRCLSVDFPDSPMLTSQRDVFYQDVALFSSQTTVDRYVDEIANSFDVPRSLLHVVRTPATGSIFSCSRWAGCIRKRIDGRRIHNPETRGGALRCVFSKRGDTKIATARFNNADSGTSGPAHLQPIWRRNCGHLEAPVDTCRGEGGTSKLQRRKN